MKTYIKFPIDPSISPRAQVEAELKRSILTTPCDHHPDVILSLDPRETLSRFIQLGLNLKTQWQDTIDVEQYSKPLHRLLLAKRFEVCSRCPVRKGVLPNHSYYSENWCAVYSREQLGANFTATSQGVFDLKPDVPVVAQLQELAKNHGSHCTYHGKPEPLKLLEDNTAPIFDTYQVEPLFASCPRCRLERHGILPADSACSFDSFVVDPPILKDYVKTCREFADDPHGIVLLLGNTGGGKTHLAIAIMRQSKLKPLFIKQRTFLDLWSVSRRPVDFDSEPPDDILRQCQRVPLLIFDEMTALPTNRDFESPLLDLFDYRIGNYLPTVITSNLSPSELEAAIGSRLFDRIRGANYATLQFDFPSRRASLNQVYLKRRKHP